MKTDQSRKTKIRSLLLSCVFAVQAGGMATAQATDPDLSAFAKSLPPEVLRQIGQRQDRYLQQMSQLIFELSPDGVATPAAAAVHTNRQAAVFRSREIMQLLRHDLDGDGDLTANEIELQLPFLQPQERAQLTLKVLEADANADQSLSLSEILATSQAAASERAQRSGGLNIDIVMAFDANADGRVDLSEISSVIAAIDPADLENTRRNPRTPNRVTCDAPRPGAASEVVFLSGYEGAAVSTLAVSGQDRETSVATVIINEGTNPLYIFATAYDSIVWQFSGATDRVKQLVVQPRTIDQGPGAAVAGIPSDKITFVAPQSCIERAVTQQNAQATSQLSRFQSRLGRPADHIIANYNLDAIQVPPAPPSAEPTTQTEGYATKPLPAYQTTTAFAIGDVRYELSATGMAIAGSEPAVTQQGRGGLSPIGSMKRFYPAGLIPLSPDDVHASAPVEPYVVLPQQAGLLQLIADGSVAYQGDRTYYIKEPIARFPAGLNGGHSVKFVLATGVEVPAGSPGHSSVISEETGECLVGVICR